MRTLACGKGSRVERASRGGLPASRGDVAEQRLCLPQERVVDRSEELQAAVAKPGRAAIGEHGDLAIELVLLLAKQILESRVLDALDGNRVELALGDRGLEGQRRIGEGRRLAEATASKRHPRGVRVPGRGEQKEIKAIAHVGELPIHFPDGLDELAAPECVIVLGSLRRVPSGELECGPLQRAGEPTSQAAMDQGELPLTLRVDRQDLQTDAEAVANSRAGSVERGQADGGRRPTPLDLQADRFVARIGRIDAAELALQLRDRGGRLTVLARHDSEVRLFSCR
jgi:hypothetical protein